MSAIDWMAESDRCVALLQDLIRIPTVNHGPSAATDGHERPAAERVAEFLRAANVEPRLFEREPGRTSIVARIKGTGEKPPLLLNAHLDVVDANASRWRHPPFGAEIHDGFVWGRGAVDMKHMVAMSACVMALFARGAQEKKLTRDLIFAGVADEEAGCTKGSIFLVDEHADHVRAEYALGEIGGFSMPLFGRTFYPVQVAEKGTCWVRATMNGDPGHGSLPDPSSAVVKLARALTRLGAKRLPVHPTEVVERSIAQMSAALPPMKRNVVRHLSTPMIAGFILDHLLRNPTQQRTFGALLSNTATPTILRAGDKINVIPPLAIAEIDGRTLPGQTTETFLAELREALGPDAKDAELEVTAETAPVTTTADTPLFETLTATLRRHDPTGIPMPYMITGFTDAQAYARLGTKCYGFAPLQFDPTRELDFWRMYHGDDERVPVDGVRWGLRVLFDAVAEFCTV